MGERKRDNIMSLSRRRAHCKYAERPPPCPVCAAASWWNGSRCVSSIHKRDDGVEHRTDVIRSRVCCPVKDCSQRSWTIYEEDSYPHRLFQLLVVVSAVTLVTLGEKTLTATAAAHQCSRDSVRRWKEWVEGLAVPQVLMRACTRLDSDGLPGGFVPNAMPRAGAVLHLLDRLAELLRARGLRLPELEAGLACVLKDQLVRFGEIFYLTKSSPPLRVDLSGIRL